MASQVVMPKQGNSVESCIIVEWKKKEGEPISVGDIICEAETDKSTIEVESTAEGTLLKLLYEEGDEVPVMLPIAIVGQVGEDISALAPSSQGATSQAPISQAINENSKEEPKKEAEAHVAHTLSTQDLRTQEAVGSSPRARNLAKEAGLDISSIPASGPKGNVVERDVKEAMKRTQPLTPLAKEFVASQEIGSIPVVGHGIGGRILASDLCKAPASSSSCTEATASCEFEDIPVKGIRKVTASRMYQSLNSTAQLTLMTYADARKLKALRKVFKSANESLQVGAITINDLVMFAVSRTLVDFPNLNAHWLGDKIRVFSNVHLGMATDTKKGLMVPVIRNANLLTLKEISMESKRLGSLCHEGKAQPDDLTGSTFTVSNVGSFGIETFTPVLNVPEVAILGVGAIVLKNVEENGETVVRESIGLSLTIDHQAVDGAPGARFLKALCENIANIDVLLASV